MLKNFIENKILKAGDAISEKRAKLDDARRREGQAQRELAESRRNPLEEKLADERRQILTLERELSEAEIAVAQEYRTGLIQRYNAARARLADALLAAAHANTAVEEIEAEAFAHYPHGMRPCAPEQFYQHSVSFAAISITKGGRIVAWLRDLLAEQPEALSEPVAAFVREDSAVRNREQVKAAPPIDLATHKARLDLVLNRGEHFHNAVIIDVSKLKPEELEQFNHKLREQDLSKLCRQCLGEGRIRPAVKRKINFGESDRPVCAEHRVSVVEA